jgi:hypothetical protein
VLRQQLVELEAEVAAAVGGALLGADLKALLDRRTQGGVESRGRPRPSFLPAARRARPCRRAGRRHSRLLRRLGVGASHRAGAIFFCGAHQGQGPRGRLNIRLRVVAAAGGAPLPLWQLHRAALDLRAVAMLKIKRRRKPQSRGDRDEYQSPEIVVDRTPACALTPAPLAGCSITFSRKSTVLGRALACARLTAASSFGFPRISRRKIRTQGQALSKGAPPGSPAARHERWSRQIRLVI